MHNNDKLIGKIISHFVLEIIVWLYIFLKQDAGFIILVSGSIRDYNFGVTVYIGK